MALYTSTSGTGGLLPEGWGDLLDVTVEGESVGLQVSTVMRTNSHRLHLPIVLEDPAAGWVSEGDEITPDDPSTSELDLGWHKLAGLTVLSSEMLSDSRDVAAELVGTGLGRDIARKLDAAFFGDVAAPAPAGLESLTEVNAVDGGTGWINLDAFSEAIADAEAVGAQVNSFVCNSATALALAQLKADSSASNVPLLAPDPSRPGGRVIFGVPMYVSSAVAADTVWGIPAGRVIVGMRQDTSVETSDSAYFTSDRVAVRGVMRCNFGFPHESSIQKITITAA